MMAYCLKTLPEKHSPLLLEVDVHLPLWLPVGAHGRGCLSRGTSTGARVIFGVFCLFLLFLQLLPLFLDEQFLLAQLGGTAGIAARTSSTVGHDDQRSNMEAARSRWMSDFGQDKFAVDCAIFTLLWLFVGLLSSRNVQANSRNLYFETSSAALLNRSNYNFYTLVPLTVLRRPRPSAFCG